MGLLPFCLLAILNFKLYTTIKVGQMWNGSCTWLIEVMTNCSEYYLWYLLFPTQKIQPRYLLLKPDVWHFSRRLYIRVTWNLEWKHWNLICKFLHVAIYPIPAGLWINEPEDNHTSEARPEDCLPSDPPCSCLWMLQRCQVRNRLVNMWIQCLFQDHHKPVWSVPHGHLLGRGGSLARMVGGSSQDCQTHLGLEFEQQYPFQKLA